MRYLYGDSTESPIEIDYLSFVRGGVDFAVAVLLIGEKLAELLDHREHLAEQAKREVAHLERLGAGVKKSLDAGTGVSSSTSLGGCASAIAEASERVIARYVQASQANLRDALAEVDQELTRQRSAAASALETLLLRHPVPGARSRLQLTLSAGERYEASLTQSSDLGLIWTTELEIPPDHLMASALRVDRAVEKLGLPRLILRTPGEGGVFRKRVKWVPQRLGRECIAGFVRGDESTTLQLRDGPAPGQPGLDIAIEGAASRVVVTPVGRDEMADSFEPDPDDAQHLIDLASALAVSVETLRENRAAIAEARFEGKPLAAYAQPADLVRRLLGAMAPVVHELAKRSPGEEELVLKRLVGDDRREELFVSFDELRGKLERLPAPLRREFAIFPFFREAPPSPPRLESVADDDEVTVDRSNSASAVASARGGGSPRGNA